MSEPEVEPEAEATSESEAISESEPESAYAESETDKDLYEGCNEDRGCFGTKFDNSNDCIENENCIIMASYVYDTNAKEFNFKLHLKTSDSNQYMAMGLSNDGSMGDDLVVSCHAQAGTDPKVSFNNGKSNVQGKSDDLLNVAATKEVDGVRFFKTFSRKKCTLI